MQARDNSNAAAISVRHSPDGSPVCEPPERVAEWSKREQSRSATPRCYRMRREFHLDKCHVTPYTLSVIKTFADKETQRIYRTGESRRLPIDLVRRAIRRLEYIDLANTLNDLRVPSGNRLHRLKKERKGQHAIAINEQWRICFRFVDGDAYDVEITDYH